MVFGHDKDNPLSQRYTSQPQSEAIRPPPCKMSNTELLRFGIVAKFMCSPEANLDNEERALFVLQLKEVKKEWKRRFPKLPLLATFEDWLGSLQDSEHGRPD